MTAPALIRPFRAIRPAPRRAADVAAPPYDVVTTEEARAQARGRPYSFLHVSRPEIDLPAGADPHGLEAYAKAAAAMRRMIAGGVLLREPAAAYYVYRIVAGDRVQTGIAAAAAVAAYTSGRIRRHELTRPEKEQDRARQIAAVGAHTGPVFVMHRPSADVAAVIADATAAEPLADVRDAGDAGAAGSARHQIWRLGGSEAIAMVSAAFEAMPALYVADGHHRAAAAARVAEAAPAVAPGRACDDGAPRFLIVSFPTTEVEIRDYNRVVADLNGLRPAQLLEALKPLFFIEAASGPVRPERPHVFGMVLAGGAWYRLTLKDPPGDEAGPLARLDVSLLSRLVLVPVLGIGDPRTDPRLDFVGGSRGLAALEEMVAGGSWAAGFSLHPTALADLMAVADAGEVMPPKSTWFEPKLADGLLSLPLNDGPPDP
jgi:uncharacterized protein (DUF1015 family)